MKVVVEPYSAEQIGLVVPVLADAFVTNPLLISAVGPGELEQNRRFFQIALEHMFKSTAFVAKVDGRICGYVHMGPWPGCLPPAEGIAAAGETILKPMGAAVPKLVEWFTAWARWDPQEPHVHLGPIGVTPAMQGKGVGSALMRRYCDHLDEKKLPGYLETDRPRNVKFYERFGFRVQREEPLIGVPTWTMWRKVG